MEVTSLFFVKYCTCQICSFFGKIFELHKLIRKI